MEFNTPFFKALLAVYKLKQAEVSLAARIPETTLSKIVCGKVTTSLKQLERIAKVLKIPPEKLLIGAPSESAFFSGAGATGVVASSMFCPPGGGPKGPPSVKKPIKKGKKC